MGHDTSCTHRVSPPMGLTGGRQTETPELITQVDGIRSPKPGLSKTLTTRRTQKSEGTQPERGSFTGDPQARRGLSFSK